jgi:hypothetical protein
VTMRHWITSFYVLKDALELGAILPDSIASCHSLRTSRLMNKLQNRQYFLDSWGRLIPARSAERGRTQRAHRPRRRIGGGEGDDLLDPAGYQVVATGADLAEIRPMMRVSRRRQPAADEHQNLIPEVWKTSSLLEPRPPYVQT